MNLTTLRTLLGASALLISTSLFFSCKKEKAEDKVTTPQGEASFALIQRKIFNTSCAAPSCHGSENSQSFVQHKLLLTEGHAYEHLFNIDPENADAKADGLKRIKPGDPELSLLYKKIVCIDPAHAEHTKQYGNQMPLGLPSLSEGQVRYIREWIAAGALKEGTINADPTLLDDTNPSCSEEFTALEAPAAGTGYQLKVDEFQVPGNFEREIFIYKNIGNPKEEYIKQVTMKMRRNSHHFLINTFPAATPAEIIPSTDVIRELRDANGNQIDATFQQMQYQQFAFASQTSTLDFSFPEGVALKIPANHKMDLNLHYVNKSSDPIPGECYVNLYTVDKSEVQHEAQPIFLLNTDLSLPPNQRTTTTHTSIVPDGQVWRVFSLTSHTHKLGEKFDIKIYGGLRNGEVVYSNNDWSHPLVKNFPEPIVLNAGEGLTMEVTFNNTTSEVVTWGFKSTDEMSIIYGYYY